MDQIRIEELEVYAYHGVNPEEKENGQRFYLNAILYTDVRKAAETDEITDSTHYGHVSKEMVRVMLAEKYNLIETACEKVAKAVLLKFPYVQAIDLELRKPEAPIKFVFESVSVRMTRGWHRVYLGIGSNLGESLEIMEEAVSKLRKNENFRNVEVSDFIKTKPYGVTDQPDFLNGALAVDTLLSPVELLTCLHEIEAQAGRERTLRWGPRTLDLDILFYDDLIMYEKDLIIPHVDLCNREFVLKPLCQLNPYLMHPVYHKPVCKLLEELDK